MLPEAARRQHARNRGEATAVAADQRGQIADAGGQQGLDQLAQAPRQNRRGAAGADRDHDLAAIDDGGKDEGRELRPVHDIDGDAPTARPSCHLGVERLARRRNDRNGVAQIGSQRIAGADFEPAASGERQLLFRHVGLAGEPAHMRAGCTQEAQLAERGLARADEDKDADGAVEKHRKETHRVGSAESLAD